MNVHVSACKFMGVLFMVVTHSGGGHTLLQSSQEGEDADLHERHVLSVTIPVIAAHMEYTGASAHF